MNINDITDPLLAAALAEDPDETEEEKQAREALLAENGIEVPKKDSDDEEENEEQIDEKDEAGDDASEDEEEDEKPEKKPVEAQDDEEDKTRQEKRQERFLDSIKKENAKTYKPVEIPTYSPLDYEQEGKEFKPEELAEDRERVGAIQYAKGAETVKYWADQDRFWSDLKTEAKFVAYDPKLSFLAETLPDGTPNPKFDPDKTGEINETFMEIIGYKETPRKDAKGNVLTNADGTPQTVATVERTDLSYEKFARRYISNIDRWSKKAAEDEGEAVRQNITKQKKQQGIRPNGGSRKTLGQLKPGDISRMSDEELEKNEAEIDRQIMSML